MTEVLEAARAWGGTNLRLIRNRENAVYEMRLPNGTHAALRLHRQGYQADAAIRSELWWCGALARVGIAVPEPLTAKTGDVLVTLSTGRMASAIEWVEGAPLGEAGQPLPGTLAEQENRHRALGRLVAQVHTATDAMELPSDFTRPRWDVDGLTGETPFWGRFWDHPSLTSDEALILQRARNFLRDALTDHLKNGAILGPIHADVLRENVLVNNKSLSLIDFDDSGIGFRLYDLGTVLSQNLYEPNYSGIRDALVEGYNSLRSADTRMVEIFTLARTMASVGWTAPRLAPDDPIHRRHINRALMWAAKIVT